MTMIDASMLRVQAEADLANAKTWLAATRLHLRSSKAAVRAEGATMLLPATMEADVFYLADFRDEQVMDVFNDQSAARIFREHLPSLVPLQSVLRVPALTIAASTPPAPPSA
jgi:hypothetical protein